MGEMIFWIIWSLLVIGFVIGGGAYHFLSHKKYNQGINRNIDEDIVYIIDSSPKTILKKLQHPDLRDVIIYDFYQTHLVFQETGKHKFGYATPGIKCEFKIKEMSVKTSSVTLRIVPQKKAFFINTYLWFIDEFMYKKLGAKPIK